MALVFFMTLPGLVVLLAAFAVLDRLGLWLHGRSGLPWFRHGHRAVSAAGFDELRSVFHPSTRHTVERRDRELVLRDDEDDGAPPRDRVDLERGRAVIIRRAAR